MNSHLEKELETLSNAQALANKVFDHANEQVLKTIDDKFLHDYQAKLTLLGTQSNRVLELSINGEVKPLDMDRI